MDVGDGSMHDAVLSVSLALFDNLLDHLERDKKLEMDGGFYGDTDWNWYGGVFFDSECSAYRYGPDVTVKYTMTKARRFKNRRALVMVYLCIYGKSFLYSTISDSLQSKILHKVSSVLVLTLQFLRSRSNCPVLKPKSLISLYCEIPFSFIVIHNLS